MNVSFQVDAIAHAQNEYAVVACHVPPEKMEWGMSLAYTAIEFDTHCYEVDTVAGYYSMKFVIFQFKYI